ncbi:hypothetical protein J2Z83_003567 [Virgibacillus natechei]|uniref:WXG100 family type VII secretion target n=1 Tax=Virgibacillus natechei TaxID=1216297 RepID=A0ABS4IKD7_9BACI|nr:hypothetical protein [Virgibacillus natechei]MBP1971428.1 hypothetical protein [Virgibacillus natechei]UZD13798.1 hypothetical protein OLD84_04400 [Virgibacillus natechei]
MQPGYEGSPYAGDAWNQPGFQGSNSYVGNPWNYSGFAGDPYSGNPYGENPWNGSGFAGDPYLGNPYLGDPLYGSPYSGNTSDGNLNGLNDYTPPERFYDTEYFKATDFAVNTMVNGTVNLLDGGIDDGFQTGMHATDLILGSAKLHVGDHAAFDAYDVGSKSYEAYNDYKALEDLRRNTDYLDTTIQGTHSANQVSNASKLRQYGSLFADSAKQIGTNMKFSNVSNTWNNMSALTKFNGVTSALNAGVSAYQKGASISDFSQTLQSDASGAEKTAAGAEIGVNLGETVMSAGGVAATIPGGQAVGLGLAAAGAGLFAVSKTTQLIANNTDKIKAGWNKTKDVAKKGWDTVTGWFS